MRNRTLTVKRETLSELSAGELSGVAGGSHLCVTDTVGHTESFDLPCRTIPVNVCLRTLNCIAIETVDC